MSKSVVASSELAQFDGMTVAVYKNDHEPPHVHVNVNEDYIAAGRMEWLYPETTVKRKGWAILDDDWFLMPNLWKIGFTKGVMTGYNDGSSWAADEYGHHPGHPKYKNDQARRDREWKTRQLSQRKWAKLRRGKSLSHTYEHDDHIHDKFMHNYLESINKK